MFFEAEEKLMSKSSLDKTVMDIITDPEATIPEDKMRLFIISLICGGHLSENEVDQYCLALEAANCDLAPLQYIRRWRSYAKMSVASSAYVGGGTKTVGMFSKLVSQASQFAMEGVKNLVVKKHNLPVTKVVDALMEMKSSQETDDYRYFDPKLLRATDSNSVPRNRSPFQEAVVFVIGGGNYIEYQNLVDYLKSKSTGVNMRRITYGCSELLNASQFLKQLGQLGREIS
ncbi:Sec1 family domain-containing protein 1 [Lamellibrachia satsuma]|nr:Sec1 family domain-containing protein 1 [Lamellibrachia satsuma]